MPHPRLPSLGPLPPSMYPEVNREYMHALESLGISDGPTFSNCVVAFDNLMAFAAKDSRYIVRYATLMTCFSTGGPCEDLAALAAVMDHMAASFVAWFPDNDYENPGWPTLTPVLHSRVVTRADLREAESAFQRAVELLELDGAERSAFSSAFSRLLESRSPSIPAITRTIRLVAVIDDTANLPFHPLMPIGMFFDGMLSELLGDHGR